MCLELFREADIQIFSWLQLLLEGIIKAFIWLDTKCLKIEIEEQVTTIPDGGVSIGGYYPPTPIRHHKHG